MSIFERIGFGALRLAGYSIAEEKEAPTVPVLSHLGGFGANATVKQPAGATQRLKDYRDWVFSCASKNAAGVAKTPLRLYVVPKLRQTKRLWPTRRLKTAETERLRRKEGIQPWMRSGLEVEEVLEHPFYDLWEKGDATLSSAQLKRLISIHMDLVGDAFLYIESNGRIPKALHVLPPDRTEIRLNEARTEVIGYRVEQGSGIDAIIYDRDEVMHVYHPDPLNPIQGLAPLEAVDLAATLYHDMTVYESSLMRNGAVPGLMFVTDSGVSGISEAQQRRFEKRWLLKHGGPQRAGTIAFISGPMKPERVGMTQKEMNWPEGRRHLREEIAAAFDVPMALLLASDTKYAASYEAESHHAKYAIAPRCILIEDQINRDIIPMYGADNIFVAFDNPVPREREYDLRRAQVMLSTDDCVELNEMRTALQLDPKPELAGQYVEQIDPFAQPRGPDKPLRPDEDNDPAQAGGEDMSQTADDQDKKCLRRAKAAGDERDRLARETARNLREFFRQQEEDVRDAILIGAATLLDPKWRGMLNAAIGMQVMAGLRLGWNVGQLDIGAGAAFDMANPAIREFTENYIVRLSGAIHETTAVRAADLLKAAFERGATKLDAAREVARQLGEDFDYRAVRIADTELMRAYNAGEVEQWRQSGLVKAYYWHAEVDACEFCRTLAAQYTQDRAIQFGNAFVSQGASIAGEDGGTMTADYSDIPYPPTHPNCILPGQRLVTPGALVAAFSAQYDGPAVELGFANGTRLAVTANHLLLTRDGFASAQSLRQGDYVLDCSGIERTIGCNPDADQGKSSVENIVAAFAKARGVTASAMPSAPEHLHGDGRHINGNVHIVRAYCPLHGTGVTSGHQHVAELPLAAVDANFPLLLRDRTLAERFRGAARAADGIMCGRRESLAFTRRSSAHAHLHGFGTSTGDYSDQSQALGHGSTRQADALRNCLDGFAGLMQSLQVVHAQTFHYQGAVYDVQTDSGLYIGNGVLSSNCRCEVRPVLVNE